MSATVYLSLGSNLGDRDENLRRALRLLGADKQVSNLRVSSLYETEPQDFADQPWFLNCAAAFETEADALSILELVLHVEQQLGRNRASEIPKGPRLIDIDILLFGDQVIRTETLEVPHPRMLQRRFVLEPLLELAPHRMDVAEQLKKLGGTQRATRRTW